MIGLNSGFGDELAPDEDYETLIRSKERLLQIQVAERLRGSHTDLWDDLINEARITLWEVAQKRPDAPPAYFHASTGKRITEVLARGVFFGMKGTQGRAIDPLRRKDRDSFDDPDFEVVVQAAERIDSVMLAYHEGEIIQAINALPPRHREYVVLRFWGGWSNAECAPVLGIKVGNVARMWTDSIRPVLAENLAHLVDA